MRHDLTRSTDFREESARDREASRRDLAICGKHSISDGNSSRSAADRQDPTGVIFSSVAARRDSSKFLQLHERDKKICNDLSASAAESPDLARSLQISRNSARCTADARDPQPVAKGMMIESPALQNILRICGASSGIEDRFRRSPEVIQKESAESLGCALIFLNLWLVAELDGVFWGSLPHSPDLERNPAICDENPRRSAERGPVHDDDFPGSTARSLDLLQICLGWAVGAFSLP